MKFADLKDESVLILGLGVEGSSTLRFLRSIFPEKTLGLADRRSLDRLSQETRQLIEGDSESASTWVTCIFRAWPPTTWS